MLHKVIEAHTQEQFTVTVDTHSYTKLCYGQQTYR